MRLFTNAIAESQPWAPDRCRLHIAAFPCPEREERRVVHEIDSLLG